MLEVNLAGCRIDAPYISWCLLCTPTDRFSFRADVPEFDPDDLHKFSKPVIIRIGQNATFKMPFTPQESLVVSWFRDGSEIKDGGGVKITREPNHSRLLLRDCLRTDAGEIKIQLKNPFGLVEATSQLIVLGKKRQTNKRKQRVLTEKEEFANIFFSSFCAP